MCSRIAPAWIQFWYHSWIAALLLLASLCIPSTAGSQTATEGSIRGMIRDQQGAVVPGATVSATSATSPGTHVTTSDSTGLYRLANLPPGEYAISARSDGFTPY